LVKATTDGVVRAPSEFSKTTGSPPSMTDMQELVAKADVRIAAEIIKRREELEKERAAAAEAPPVIGPIDTPAPIGSDSTPNLLK
jgi:hypothetical protein